MEVLIGLIIVFFLYGIVAHLHDLVTKKLGAAREIKKEIREKQTTRDLKQAEWEKRVQLDMTAIDTLAKEKTQGFPWLAQAYADHFHLQDLKSAEYLRHKSHPARKAAEYVKRIAMERRIAEKLYRHYRYLLQYYEDLFPWLVDFQDEGVEDLIRQIVEKRESGDGPLEEPDDPAKNWLTSEEYNKLPHAEKYQRALDRYWQKTKRKWEIGRDYERYIGYLYEDSGYDVYYQGIVEGLRDLGRDIVAVKSDETRIVQCKCWSQQKTIHEKHIFQLFGTTVEYILKNRKRKDSVQPTLFPELLRDEKIKAALYTSTKVSEMAKDFARVLNVGIEENFSFRPYPSIKCNVARRTSEKIYHLPFDQQYDRTLVEEERNECYVWTVKEAEDLGFRRAFRWRGKDERDLKGANHQ